MGSDAAEGDNHERVFRQISRSSPRKTRAGSNRATDSTTTLVAWLRRHPERRLFCCTLSLRSPVVLSKSPTARRFRSIVPSIRPLPIIPQPISMRSVLLRIWSSESMIRWTASRLATRWPLHAAVSQRGQSECEWRRSHTRPFPPVLHFRGRNEHAGLDRNGAGRTRL